MWGLLAASGSWGFFWGAWAALLPGMGRLADRYGRRGLGVTLACFAAVVPLPGLASGVLPLAGALLRAQRRSWPRSPCSSR